MEFVAYYFTVVTGIFAAGYLLSMAKDRGIIVPRKSR